MIDELRVIVAVNIKRYRKKNQMTQAQLAEKIGKTVEMVCQLENNIASTKLSTLEKIAQTFGIEPFQLLLPREIPNYDHFSSELTELMLEIQDQPKEFLDSLTKLLKYHVSREKEANK